MKRFAWTVPGLSSVLAVTLLSYGIVRSIQFDQQCNGFLKRAADANTVELARQELGKAVDFIEQSKLTSGSTHVVYWTPDCDLEFWYTNLKASLSELESIPTNADRLTISNQLIKLRETIVDQKEKGTKVTRPPNIHVFPNQFVYRSLGLASLVGLGIGGFCMASACGQCCESSSGSRNPHDE